MPRCRVCQRADCRHFAELEDRTYWRCDRCMATLLDECQLPSATDERAQYDLHQNHIDDPHYRGFLNRLATPLLERLPAHSEGLDYGCGPGPALAAMLREAGHQAAVYDPIYAPDARALERQYDFITCTEAVEHFHFPARDFQRFDAMLRSGGWLGIMTTFQTDDARFANWHYRRDPTHVTFYREATFRQIAKDFGWHCEIAAANVVMMRKM